MPTQVTGTGLLSLIKDVGADDKRKLLTMAGYIRPDGKLAYTAFYEALLTAKGYNPDQLTYDEDDYSQEWCECIAKHLPNIDEQDARDHIAKELEDLGIEDEEQLTENYEGCYDTWTFYEEFCEEFISNYDINIPDFIRGCIDYEALWESALRYDYNTFEFGDCTYVFRNF
jgi:hypothetical protein